MDVIVTLPTLGKRTNQYEVNQALENRGSKPVQPTASRLPRWHLALPLRHNGHRYPVLCPGSMTIAGVLLSRVRDLPL